MTSKRTEALPLSGAPTGLELVHVAKPDGAGGYDSRAMTTAELAGLAIGGEAAAELVRDTIAAALIAGGMIQIINDDAGNTITIAVLIKIEEVPGAAYQFVLADTNKHKRFTNAGAVTATVPLNATVPFPIGTRIRLTQAGAGQVTLAKEDPSIELRSADDALKSAKPWAVFEIEKVNTDEWDVLGHVAA